MPSWLVSLPRLAPMLLMGAALLLSTGCAHRATSADEESYSATAQATMNPQLPTSQARRDAIARADRMARDQVLLQLGQLRTPDGQHLEDLAIVDPFVKAVMDDTVRAAHTADRTVSPDGVVTVTVKVELDPINRMLASYAEHAVR